MKKCANCGEPIRLSDGRYKYCSYECYKEAHRHQCRERFRRYYIMHREKELERYHRRYHKEAKK